MKVEELLVGARDSLSVRSVYGEPYERDGVTLITAAALRGGGGAGENEDGGTAPGGAGGGFGMTARPVGAYQITGEEVSWIPAADTTRVIITSQIMVIAALLVLRSILRRKARRG